MGAIITKQVYDFLIALKENNTRDWMQAHKSDYQQAEETVKNFSEQVKAKLNQTDVVDQLKIYKIHRDIRFSKDKTPYNIHRGISFSREGAHRRGGYFLWLEPGKTMMAGGFFQPEPNDLLRIRKEFQQDASTIEGILKKKAFAEAFGGFDQTFSVKTSPKGFSKNEPNIALIKLKSFIVQHNFTDEEVFATDFQDILVQYFSLLRPYFDYMSEILTTDLNGVSII